MGFGFTSATRLRSMTGYLILRQWMTCARHLGKVAKRLQIRLEIRIGGQRQFVGFGVTRAEAFIGRETKALAAKADAVIICAGFDPKTEGEGFDRLSSFRAAEDELIRQISAVNQERDCCADRRRKRGHDGWN